MMFENRKVIENLVEEKIYKMRNSWSYTYVKLDLESQNQLRDLIDQKIFERIQLSMNQLVADNIKTAVEEAVREVIAKTDVIEQLVAKVNNVQIKE